MYLRDSHCALLSTIAPWSSNQSVSYMSYNKAREVILREVITTSVNQLPMCESRARLVTPRRSVLGNA